MYENGSVKLVRFFCESDGSVSMKLKNSILNKPLKKIFNSLTVIKTFCIMI